MVGLIGSTIINLWIGIGTSATGISTAKLKPQFTDGCIKNISLTTSIITTTTTTITTTTKAPQTIENLGYFSIYSIDW